MQVSSPSDHNLTAKVTSCRRLVNNALLFGFESRTYPATTNPLIRLHDFRHLHATYLIAAGVDSRTTADRLGHTDPGFPDPDLRPRRGEGPSAGCGGC